LQNFSFFLLRPFSSLDYFFQSFESAANVDKTTFSKVSSLLQTSWGVTLPTLGRLFNTLLYLQIVRAPSSHAKVAASVSPRLASAITDLTAGIDLMKLTAVSHMIIYYSGIFCYSLLRTILIDGRGGAVVE
jgi:hypothetical protein